MENGTEKAEQIRGAGQGGELRNPCRGCEDEEGLGGSSRSPLCVRMLRPRACAALDKEPGPPARQLLATRAGLLVATVTVMCWGCHLSAPPVSHSTWLLSPPCSALSASLCSGRVPREKRGENEEKTKKNPSCCPAWLLPALLAPSGAAAPQLWQQLWMGGHGEPSSGHSALSPC